MPPVIGLSSHQQHLTDWCIWKVVLPFLLLVLLWPIYKFVGVAGAGHNDAFIQAFEHGDLLIFAALLFIEVGLESAEASGRLSLRQYILVQVSKGVAMVLLFVLGFIKYDVLTSATEQRRLAYSWLSFSVAFLAVGVSLWSFYKSIDNATTRRLHDSDGGVGTMGPQVP